MGVPIGADSSQPTADSGGPQSNLTVTLGLTVLVAAYLAWVFPRSPFDRLDMPHRTTIHVMERSLDLAEVGQELPAPIRWLAGLQSPEETRAWAEDAYEEVIRARIDAHGDAPLDLVRRNLQDIGEPRAPSRVLSWRLLLYQSVVASILVLGFGALLIWVGRSRTWPVLGTAKPMAPWSVAEGYAVAVRAAFIGFLITLTVFALIPFLRHWATLLASVAMIFLMQNRLLLPRDLGFRDTLGLTEPHDTRALGFLCLTIVALSLAGAWGITWVCGLVGAHDHWTEFVMEDLLFGSVGTASLEAADAILWAPLFEEIGFRGLVYATLRTRLRVAPAAVLSATLFAGAHFYTWPGFLSVLWSGVLLAVLYEKTRSLWPCIACHAATNSLYVVWVLLNFR